MSPRRPSGRVRAKLFTAAGESSGEVDLPSDVFGEAPNAAVMHQAHLRQLANARQGTASTKTRGDVSGGGAKPYRQKGTGRARHGSEREPEMPGGGIVFGPHPRSYRQAMPRKMRRLALRSALSVKAAEGRISVLEGFDFEEPKTRRMAELLRAAGAEGTVLLVLASSNQAVARSVANLPWAKATLVSHLGIHDLFTYDHMVMQRDALEMLRDTFGSGRAPEDLPEGGAAAPPEPKPARSRARPKPAKAGKGATSATARKAPAAAKGATSRTPRKAAAPAKGTTSRTHRKPATKAEADR